MHRQTIYITYDLPVDEEGSQVLRQALSHVIQGYVVRSQVGEFKSASGNKIPGARLTVALEEDEDVEKVVIEVPANAQNIQVHLDHLPELYQTESKKAA